MEIVFRKYQAVNADERLWNIEFFPTNSFFEFWIQWNLNFRFFSDAKFVMTDVELETRNFLRELETFGQPPPPQRLVSDADSKAMSKEFELKLHYINMEKQKVNLSIS